MTKRVLGVLAALTIGGSALACSSSSGGGAAPTDTGPAKTDGGTDSGKPDTGKPDTAPPAPVFPNTDTVGKTCASNDDCDPTGDWSDYVYCSPLPNATPVCSHSNQTEDSCDMGDGTTIPVCDKDGRGLCTKYMTNPTQCQPKCELNADGTWKQQCEGKNSCQITLTGTTMDMKTILVGTCEGGCQTDADCTGRISATPLKCDPVLQYCLPGCNTDADCKVLSVTSPLWKCDTTRKACTFMFPKKLGETCTTEDDCVCFKNTADTSGYCSRYCKTGGSADCGTGYSCDLGIGAKTMSGADLVSFTTPPAGLFGLCMKNCTADTDCITGQVCIASAGTAQKTCQPKSM